MTSSQPSQMRSDSWSWHDQAPAVVDAAADALHEGARAQRRIWLLETLHAVSHTIAGMNDVDRDLQMLADEICARFRFSAVGIGVVDGDTLAFRGLAATRGRLLPRIPITKGICGRVLRTGMGELVTDVRSDPDYLMCSEQTRRAVAIPIMIDGVAWGVLNVEAEEAVPLDPEAYDVLYTLTTSLRQTISRANQRRTEQRRLRQLASVQRIARLIERATEDDDERDVIPTIADLLDYGHVGLGILSANQHDVLGYSSLRDYLNSVPPAVRTLADEGVVGRVLRTEEPAFVRDVAQDSDFQRQIRDTTQEICVPIRAHGDVLGVLNAELDDRRAIDDSDLTILLTIADHLGSAIARHQRIQELERRTEQLRRVEEITRQIAGMLDVRDSLWDVVQQMERIFAFSTAGIGLLRNGRLHFCAFEGNFSLVPPEIMSHGISITSGVTGRVARTGRAELILDVSSDPDYVESSPDIRHEACAPILTASGVAGIINVESTAERPLNAGDLEIISIIAGHLGVALEKHDLHTAERRTRVALEAMQRVSNIVASALDPHEALKVMAATLSDAFGYPYVQISLLEGFVLVPTAYEGGASHPPQTVEVGEGIIGRVADTGTAAYLRDPRDLAHERGALDNMTSAIAVPIRHAGKLTGVLNVEGTDWRELTLEDVHLLQTFAEHAGTILHNAQVYARMEWLASRDPLTNLPNYREFRDQFRLALAHAQRHDRPVSLLVIDLDEFKVINDRFGHLAGDEALRVVASRLGSELRTEDLLARYAGDEFVVILPDTERVEAEAIAARLATRVSAEPIPLDGDEVHVRLSLGVATWPDNGATPDVLIDHADDLMYQVKRTTSQSKAANTQPTASTFAP